MCLRKNRISKLRLFPCSNEKVQVTSTTVRHFCALLPKHEIAHVFHVFRHLSWKLHDSDETAHLITHTHSSETLVVRRVKPFSHLRGFFSQRQIQDQLEFQLFRCQMAHTQIKQNSNRIHQKTSSVFTLARNLWEILSLREKIQASVNWDLYLCHCQEIRSHDSRNCNMSNTENGTCYRNRSGNGKLTWQQDRSVTSPLFVLPRNRLLSGWYSWRDLQSGAPISFLF